MYKLARPSRSKERRVSLMNPCSENWQDMRRDVQGRFCSSCQKTVVDFSKMSTDEFIHYFQHHTTSGCGRFTPEQFSIRIPETTRTIPFIGRVSKYAAALFATLSIYTKGVAQTNTPIFDTVQTTTGATGNPIPAGDRLFTGKVLDDKGEGVPGATVMIDEGTMNGTATDADGWFEIKLNAKDKILIVHSAGYMDQEVSIAGQNNIVVNLELDTSLVDAVTAYGTYMSDIPDPKANLWHHIKNLFKKQPE